MLFRLDALMSSIDLYRNVTCKTFFRLFKNNWCISLIGVGSVCVWLELCFYIVL